MITSTKKIYSATLSIEDNTASIKKVLEECLLRRGWLARGFEDQYYKLFSPKLAPGPVVDAVEADIKAVLQLAGRGAVVSCEVTLNDRYAHQPEET